MKTIVSAVLLSTVFWSGIAYAQAGADDANGDILVTASKTGATRLQDTPLAITAFNAAKLEATGIKDVRDLASLTPNLQVTQNASFSQVYIRGIGSNNVFGGSDPSSTIHLDGVYLARPASYLSNFLDVERIEVLRGPQGTLYGRNSVGGTINIVSRKPTDELTAKAQLTYGNYDLARIEGYISGPVLQDKVSASISFIGSRRDGYLKNVVAGVGDADNERTIGTRGQLRFTPSQPLEIILRADYVHSDDALAGYVKLLQTTTDPQANSILGDYRKVALNIRPASNRTQWGTAGEVNYDLGGNAKIKSLTAYRSSRLVQVGDTDGTALNGRRTDQYENQHQFSEELNLTDKIGGLTYIIGAYYFNEHIDVDSSVTTYSTGVRANFAPTIDTTAWAGFVQGNYALTDQLSVTAGIRYTQERKHFDQVATNFSLATGLALATYPRVYSIADTYKAWTPKFGVEYRPVEGVMLYASATRGFKSGGFNFSSSNAAQGFAPETLWSYEAGTKLDLFDRKLRLNGTYFHYDYKGLQVQSFLTPGVVDITNASDATVNGVEFEAEGHPAKWLQLGANLAYLDAVYKNYTEALAAGNVPFDASGNRLNLSPKWSYTLYAQVDASLGGGSVFARGEYSYRTRQYFTAVNGGLDQQAGYSLINASVGYTLPGDNIQILLFGRNLADKEYVTSTASFASGIVGRVGEPRTYGVRLVFKY
ncbi:MAG: TonB-dependent receptor [Cereibacter sphaeroides]|uniref:TonB-dependent receptor n=1 Tax=Cereibacter sphaeroides TaxID=1063 RepID=A0A2W5TGY8_CERSP|nr:MAG: TonB-dependent receptor [Cereibacter sphaeroides]